MFQDLTRALGLGASNGAKDGRSHSNANGGRDMRSSLRLSRDGNDDQSVSAFDDMVSVSRKESDRAADAPDSRAASSRSVGGDMRSARGNRSAPDDDFGLAGEAGLISARREKVVRGAAVRDVLPLSARTSSRNGPLSARGGAAEQPSNNNSNNNSTNNNAAANVQRQKNFDGSRGGPGQARGSPSLVLGESDFA